MYTVSAILLVGIYLTAMQANVLQGACTRILLVLVFIIAHKWKQLKCLPILGWVNYGMFLQESKKMTTREAWMLGRDG